MMIKYCITLLCIAVTSGCISSDSEKLAHRYQSSHIEYHASVIEESLNIAPEESDGINLKHRLIIALVKMDAEELRFALDTHPERIDLGPNETPWVMVEHAFTEHDGVSKKTKQLYRKLSDELNTHPKRTRIHAISKQAAGTLKCKSAWQTKDKQLVTIARDIDKFRRKKTNKPIQATPEGAPD